MDAYKICFCREIRINMSKIMKVIAYAGIGGSDEPAQTHSLASATVCKDIGDTYKNAFVEK